MSHTILVVDDEADIRKFITAVLKKRGYETLTAENGRQALEVVEREHPDLVILDLQMPNHTGTDFYPQAGERQGPGSNPDDRGQRPGRTPPGGEKTVRSV